jgi:hypothetical protein
MKKRVSIKCLENLNLCVKAPQPTQSDEDLELNPRYAKEFWQGAS